MAVARFCRGAFVVLLASLGSAYAQTPPASAPGSATPAAPSAPAPVPAAPAVPAAPLSPAAPPSPAPVDTLGYNSRQWRIERIDANHLRLIGQVEVEREKLKFFADTVDIFNDRDLLVAEGNVVYVNATDRLAAERIEFDFKKQVGTFYDASGIARIQPKANRAAFGGQDAEVYFYGKKIEKIGPRKYRLTDGAFTTCVQPEPRWELTAGTVTLNIDEYATATNTVLRVKGVPLFYLPAIYYPINKDERSTGFLMPTYGSSTFRGQSISNGFFWAISRSRDATFTHDWFSQTGQGFGADYRYIGSAPASLGAIRTYVLRQRMSQYKTPTGTATLPATRSYNFVADATQAFGAGLRGVGHVDYFSNVTTQQLYQTNIYQASQQTRTIAGSVAGAWGRYNMSTTYQRSEVFSSSTQSFVVGNAPRLSAAVAPTRLLGTNLYASLNTDFSSVLYKSIDRKGKTIDNGMLRFDLFPSLRMPVSNWQFLTVNLSGGARSTYFSDSRDAKGVQVPVPITRKYVQGRADIIGPVFMKIWDTPGSRTIERRKHIIEPAFSIDRTSNFDFKRVLVLSDTSDYVVPGNVRVTYGVTNRFLDRGRGTAAAPGVSREFFTIGVQQSYYTNQLASQYDTTYTTAYVGQKPRPLSPVAIVTRAYLAPHVDANGRVEYDIQGLGLKAITTGTTIAASNGSTGTLSWSWSRLVPTQKPSSLVSGVAVIRARERKIGGQYGMSYDVQRATMITQQIVGYYNAQCCGFAIEFQKYNFPQIDPRFPIPRDTRINFSVTLAGLGSVSNFHGALSAIPR